MKLLPFQSETIVLPYSAGKVMTKLWHVTYPVTAGEKIPDVPQASFLLNGWIQKHRFRVSRKIESPENFLPVISGTIENTSVGSILFVRYSMFFSSKVFLVFWSVITLLIGLFFLIYHKIYLYTTLSFLAGIANYAIAIVNFNIQVKKSKSLLSRILQ